MFRTGTLRNSVSNAYPSNNSPRTPAQRWNGSTFITLREWLASEGLSQAHCQSTYDMVPADIQAKWEARWRAATHA
jgi:hypothetical protein